MKWYWLFGPGGRVVPEELAPQWVRGEELVKCDEGFARLLERVPEEFRWEAAQGASWTPTREFREWLEKNPELAAKLR